MDPMAISWRKFTVLLGSLPGDAVLLQTALAKAKEADEEREWWRKAFAEKMGRKYEPSSNVISLDAFIRNDS